MSFVDDRHTLYVGWVLGLAIKHDLDASPVFDDDGNYTDRLIIGVGNRQITVVVPPPPDDWNLE